MMRKTINVPLRGEYEIGVDVSNERPAVKTFDKNGWIMVPWAWRKFENNFAIGFFTDLFDSEEDPSKAVWKSLFYNVMCITDVDKGERKKWTTVKVVDGKTIYMHQDLKTVEEAKKIISQDMKNYFFTYRKPLSRINFRAT